MIVLSSSLSTGAAVEISGVWKACPPGKEQSHELQTTDVTVVGAADPEVSVAATGIEGIRQPDTEISITDLSNPEEIPQPRLPPSNTSPPSSDTLSIAPRAFPLGMPISAGHRLSCLPQRRLHAGATSDNHLV